MTDQALIINIDTLKVLLKDSVLWKDAGACGGVFIFSNSGDTFGASLLAMRAAVRTGTRDLSLAVAGELAAHAAVGFPEATILNGNNDSQLGNAIHQEMVALQWGAEATELLAELPNPPGRKVLVLSEASPAAMGSAAVVVVGPGDSVGPGDGGSIEERTTRLKQAATESQSVLVDLQGDTLVGCPDGRVFVNAESDHNLSKTGGAAVLAGVVASLLAQGATALEAAVLGVHLHSMATDAAAKDIGVRSIIGRDVAERLASSLRYAEKMCGPHKEEARYGLRRSG